ncbi:MAG: hypothetical protein CVT49_12580 [candidate division Zixibacteria bacterium HGW-Zixibacteria-1]|nr:MAG: hypothetical protein CVT49_12580 [candidate division Zixibacteria bacterium HGW-Zixibacteria-1]
MTEERCIDPEAGKLLHAYELGALPVKECELFEAHLLECKACFSEAQSFCAESNLLISNKSIIEEVASAVGLSEATVEKRSLLSGLISRLWPDTPFVFRPALALVIIILLLYPAYKGIQKNPDEGIKAVSAVNLMPTRSSSTAEFNIPDDNDVVLSFLYQDVVPGREYIIEITDENGRTLMLDKSFNAFDKYEMGRLLIPADKIKTGVFELKLSDPEDVSSGNEQIYKFRLIK